MGNRKLKKNRKPPAFRLSEPGAFIRLMIAAEFAAFFAGIALGFAAARAGLGLAKAMPLGLVLGFVLLLAATWVFENKIGIYCPRCDSGMLVRDNRPVVFRCTNKQCKHDLQTEFKYPKAGP